MLVALQGLLLDHIRGRVAKERPRRFTGVLGVRKVCSFMHQVDKGWLVSRRRTLVHSLGFSFFFVSFFCFCFPDWTLRLLLPVYLSCLSVSVLRVYYCALLLLLVHNSRSQLA